jgi:hypothetical protein
LNLAKFDSNLRAMITKVSNNDENAELILKHIEPNHLREKVVSSKFPVKMDSYILMTAESNSTETRVRRLVINESVFPQSQLNRVISVLKQVSTCTEIFCFYNQSYLTLRDDFNKDVEHIIYKCDLDDLVELSKMKENDFTPTIWWAGDRSWFFLHDYDSGYATVGGSAKIIEALKGVTPVFVEVLENMPNKHLGRFYNSFVQNFNKYYRINITKT